MGDEGKAETNHETIRLYLGNGCGKTTATFGVLLRSISSGKNVTLVFFDKLEANTSEGIALDKLSKINEPGLGRLQVFYTGINRLGAGPGGSFRFYSSLNGILPEDKAEAVLGLAHIKEALMRADDLVIADELLDVVRVGLVTWEDFKAVLRERRDPTVLILTGRTAPDWLMDSASTITRTTQEKHHGRAIVGLDC